LSEKKYIYIHSYEKRKMILLLSIFYALYVVLSEDIKQETLVKEKIKRTRLLNAAEASDLSKTALVVQGAVLWSLRKRGEFDESKIENPAPIDDRHKIYSISHNGHLPSECAMVTDTDRGSIQIMRNFTKAVTRFLAGWTTPEVDIDQLLERFQPGIIKDAFFELYDVKTAPEKLAPFVEMIRLTSWTCWFRSSMATVMFSPLVKQCLRIAPEAPKLIHPVFRDFFDATGFEYNECAHFLVVRKAIIKNPTKMQKECEPGGVRPHELFIELALRHKNCDHVCANALAFALLARLPGMKSDAYYYRSALPSAQQALRRGLSLLPEKALSR